MGMTAEARPSDIERALWFDIPPGKAGIVTSIRELYELFPANERYCALEILRNCTNGVVYGQKSLRARIMPRSLAYECGSCKKVVLGPPTIQDRLPPRNRTGYDLHCAQCTAQIDSVDIAVS